MPTKRLKISRTPIRVTPRALELYKTGLRTEPHWEACRASSTINCTHPECAEYIEAFSALNMEFSIRPHEPSPIDSYERIRACNYHERIIPMKRALDAALQAEIATAAGEDHD